MESVDDVRRMELCHDGCRCTVRVTGSSTKELGSGGCLVGYFLMAYSFNFRMMEEAALLPLSACCLGSMHVKLKHPCEEEGPFMNVSVSLFCIFEGLFTKII